MSLHIDFETGMDLERAEILARSIDGKVLDRFPLDYLQRNCVLPVQFDPGTGRLEIVLTHPDRVQLIEEMVQMVGGRGALVRRAPRDVIDSLLTERGTAPGDGRTEAEGELRVDESPPPLRTSPPPVASVKPAASSTTDTTGVAAHRSRRSEHVLLVEEDPSLRFAIGGIFQSEGHRVTAVEDLGVLQDVLRNTQFDVLLLKSEHVDEQPELLDDARARFPGAQITVVRSFAGLLRGEPVAYEASSRFWFEFAELTERVLGEATSTGSPGTSRERWYATRVAQHLGLARRTVDTLRACMILEQLARVQSGQHRQPSDAIECTRESATLEVLVRELRCPYDVLPVSQAAARASSGDGPLPPVEAQVLVAARRCVALQAETEGLDDVISALRSETGVLYEVRVAEALIGILRSERLLGALDRRRRIVIADPSDSLALELSLSNDGYDVEVCPDGESALAAILRAPADLVIAEVVLPKIDGFGLLTKLRSDRRTARVPFLFLSSRQDSAALARGLRLGAEDYLVKPMNPEIVAIKAARLAGSGAIASTTITGILEEVSLVDVLQLLSEGQKTACIELSAGVSSGEIYLRNGELVHAHCGEHDGEPAFLKLMQASVGRFSVKADHRAPCESIDEALEALILEGLEGHCDPDKISSDRSP